MLAAVLCIASPSSWAQYQALSTGAGSFNAGQPLNRVLPEQALFGTLLIEDATTARINGKPFRLAPGMRLFSQNNTLIHTRQATGERLRVRYMMEASTGMLQTAWILRESEIPPRQFFGLFGPSTQDPHEVQTGPLGVGTTKDGQAPATGTAASSALTPATGHNSFGGH